MKTIRNIFRLLVLIAGFNSCMDKYSEVFTANCPVYMSYEELRASVEFIEAKELKNPGKIYFKDGYIFINEELQGIHIIDNQDPTDPKNIGFIQIPGNIDIAIKDDILYADSYIDMVAIDISDISNPVEVNRIEDVFPYTTPAYDEDYRVAEVNTEKGVVVDWEIKEVRQTMEYYYYPIYYSVDYSSAYLTDALSLANGASSGSTFGIGGSMARFGLYDEYLYTVDNSVLYMFDVHSPESPVSIGSQSIGWNVETMFITDDYMFFGTQTGMRIFTLDVPTVPKYVGDFWHITSCDPVVVSDGYAYVTLRGETTCGSDVNRLDVLKLSDDYLDNELLASYPLTGPYGLGIDDEILFVCDGDAGLKVYDVSDKLQIDDNQIATFPNINTYDVIPVNGYLFMIGSDGFYQYDYSDIQNISQVSVIPVATEE